MHSGKDQLVYGKVSLGEIQIEADGYYGFGNQKQHGEIHKEERRSSAVADERIHLAGRQLVLDADHTASNATSRGSVTNQYLVYSPIRTTTPSSSYGPPSTGDGLHIHDELYNQQSYPHTLEGSVPTDNPYVFLQELLAVPSPIEVPVPQAGRGKLHKMRRQGPTYS